MKGKTIALLAIGAAAVLLLTTTEKGKKLRGTIADKAEDWGDNFGEMGSKAADEMGSFRKKIMNEIEGLAGDVRDRLMDLFEEGTEKGRKLTKMGRERLS